MKVDSIISDFRRSLCSEINIEAQGSDRFIIYVPFMFDDGDHFVVLLKRDNGQWALTDEGHTFMHMEYSGVDFRSPSRWKVIEAALASHQIRYENGQLKVPLEDLNAGDRLFSFVQGLARISNVTAMTREAVRSTFMEDFRQLVTAVVPGAVNIHFDWSDPEHDPDGLYPVDCRLDAKDRPWFLFGIGNDDKCNLVSLTCMTFEKWRIPFRSIAIFRDQTEIGRKPLARLSDLVGKQLSSIDEQVRIRSYFATEVLPSIVA